MENSCKVTPRPKNIREFFTTWYFWKPFIGVVTGVLGGFFGFFVTGSPCARFGR
jgi:hypothetical protein